MDKFNVIKNEKFTVGKIQTQRINITHKKKAKHKNKKILKKLLNKSMISIFEIRTEHRKF